VSVEFPFAEPWDWSQLQDRTHQEHMARLAREGRLPQGRYSDEEAPTEESEDTDD
jgi:hypothetical protein